MTQLRWIALDGAGETTIESPGFGSRDEAEAWMGTEWSRLAEGGAESVVLRDGDVVVYEMSLRPE